MRGARAGKPALLRGIDPQLLESGDTMNNKPGDLEEDDIPETDFTGGGRGKYYKRATAGTNIVLLEPDVAKVFRDSAVVSQALREYLSEHGAPPSISKQRAD
jgi:hypothetical protein